jgi:hypothetical protein
MHIAFIIAHIASLSILQNWNVEPDMFFFPLEHT